MTRYIKRVKPLMEKYGFKFSDYGKTITYGNKVLTNGAETKLLAISEALEKHFKGNRFHYVYLNKSRSLIDYERMLLLEIEK